MGEDVRAGDASGDSELTDVLRLALVPGVGPRLRRALLERCGSAAEVLAASADELRQVRGVGPKLVRAIRSAPGEAEARGVLALCAARGAQAVADTDPHYPRLLSQIPDPPGVLFLRGEVRQQDEVAVAIVGTRHASHYGKTQAERLGAGLARAGVTIVSGLARGIDAAAHRGAVGAEGRTIAVLGSGILNVYPPEHRDLAEKVVLHGALLSESPPEAEPLAGTFPQRNRIISGLSLGVIVVEAAERSGALITARHAMEQGREVFAVPGRVDMRTSRGCHRLIRDGARLVESPDDVLDELGPLVQPAQRDDGRVMHHPAELLLNDAEQSVLDAVLAEPTSVDSVVRATGLPVPRVLATLNVLEMRRLVRRVSGSLVVRG